MNYPLRLSGDKPRIAIETILKMPPFRESKTLIRLKSPVIVCLMAFAGFLAGTLLYFAFRFAEGRSVYLPLGRWKRVTVAPSKPVGLVAYRDRNLFIKTPDGTLYACGTDVESCLRTDGVSEKEKQRFCGEPGSLTPFAPGKIVKALAVRICYPDAYSDIHFILLENGSIWTWDRWWSGNEQSFSFALCASFGALTSVIVTLIFLRRRHRFAEELTTHEKR